MYFEPEKKKDDTETFKFILFAAVIGIAIYTYTTKQSKQIKIKTPFTRTPTASSVNSDFSQFMAMYKG